ncbi:chemotaxis protein CheX [Jannaschia sp. R86511]|uniref:chemotaxis protein CheX n=1 Tax=Jannaschia sp. R86511 TaxID=3093853 RepID=UPI0036D3F174
MSVDGEVLAELTQAVWESFVDAELPLVDLYGAPLDPGPDGVVVGTILIHGPHAGRINVSLPAQAASAAAARMLDMAPGDVVEADVHDATGELANMIGGNVKAMLEGEHHLGLPSVTVAPTDPYDAVASATLLWGEHTLLVTLETAPGGTS